jgi:hypothetical protein
LLALITWHHGLLCHDRDLPDRDASRPGCRVHLWVGTTSLAMLYRPEIERVGERDCWTRWRGLSAASRRPASQQARVRRVRQSGRDPRRVPTNTRSAGRSGVSGLQLLAMPDTLGPRGSCHQGHHPSEPLPLPPVLYEPWTIFSCDFLRAVLDPRRPPARRRRGMAVHTPMRPRQPAHTVVAPSGRLRPQPVTYVDGLPVFAA